MRYTFLSFGELLWDLFPDGKVLGGAPANLAYFLHGLGESAILYSQVGDDLLGEEASQKIQALQLPAILPKSPYPTGQVKISFNEHNEPHYQFNKENAWDHLTFREFKGLQELKYIAFGSLALRSLKSREALQSLLNAAPHAGRFLDLNLRAPHYSEETLRFLLTEAEILKINEEELTILKDLFHISQLSLRDALFNLLEQLDLALILLTLGAKGSIVMSRSDYSARSASQLPGAFVDSVGAGDAFSAAFLAALQQGAELTIAHQLASDFSAFICTQKGAFVPIPAHFQERLKSSSPW